MGELFCRWKAWWMDRPEPCGSKKSWRGSKRISKFEQKLANPSFTQKFPPNIWNEHQRLGLTRPFGVRFGIWT